MPSDVALSLASLGVTDAPVPRAGLACALEFSAQRMPSLSEKKLSAFRNAGENPLKLFYTKAGTLIHSLGINPSTRGFRRFRVAQAVVALESRCTGARDTWTDADAPYVASGGGLQYIVPNANTVLAVIQ